MEIWEEGAPLLFKGNLRRLLVNYYLNPKPQPLNPLNKTLNVMVWRRPFEIWDKRGHMFFKSGLGRDIQLFSNKILNPKP